MTVRDPGKVAQHGCYAYFPGTGPAGALCLNCAHRTTTQGVDREYSYCGKWRELVPDRRIKTKPIDAYTPACKYFEQAQRKRFAGPPVTPHMSGLTVNND